MPKKQITIVKKLTQEITVALDPEDVKKLVTQLDPTDQLAIMAAIINRHSKEKYCWLKPSEMRLMRNYLQSILNDTEDYKD